MNDAARKYVQMLCQHTQQEDILVCVYVFVGLNDGTTGLDV